MVEIKTCNQCGHIWTPRSEDIPRACPKCKRYDWNNKKVKKEKKDGI